MKQTELHGWKWLGAPHSGVLGLFPAQTSVDPTLRDDDLPNEPSRASEGSSQTENGGPIDPAEFPTAVRLVLLAVETVMAFAVALLGVWCATIARTICSALLAAALAECIYTVVISGMILLFAAKIFQQNDRQLFLRRLGVFTTPLSAVTLSVTLHLAILVFSRIDIDVSAHSVFSLDTATALRSLLLAPVEEELFFRGLVFHLALHRLKRHPSPSAIISGVSFALVHFANARRLGIDASTKSSDLLLQVLWAAIVGVVLSLRYFRKGSLLECVLLHAINNIFAAAFAHHRATRILDFVVVFIYCLAGAREWWKLTDRRRP